jgi:uncharacterized protein (TIGR02246 family)
VPGDTGADQLVDLVRKLNAAWNRREIDAYLSLFTHDCVYQPIARNPDSEERRGRDALRGFMEEFWQAWDDDFVGDLDSIRVYGDAVIARVRFNGHARRSGVAIDERLFEVFWLRDGLIARVQDFVHRDEALKAVGLEE